MDLQANSRHAVLEHILLNENAKPADLPLSLLESITNSFSPALEIGRGGFGVVYKGIVGKEIIAVKKLSKTIDIVHENKFHNELECLMNAKHKNIVRFLGYCSEAHGITAEYEGKFVMANVLNWLLCFEYAPNGNLQKYIADASGGIEWRVRFRIIKGICEGLHYLHMNRILHLDLKPANILLDSHMVPKIADFGLSRYLNEEKTHDTTTHLLGTMGYMAPELFGGKITLASDIYSLGNIIMEIITGVKGYSECDNVIESWMDRLEGDTELQQVRACTTIGIKCIESAPKKRPDMQHIINTLNKTAGADESESSPLVELELGLLKEQLDRERIRKLVVSVGQNDIKEHPGTLDVAEHLGKYQTQQGEEDTAHWSLWEAQDTERKVERRGKGILSSTSSVLDKLNILSIFRRKKHRYRIFWSLGGSVLSSDKTFGDQLSDRIRFEIFPKEELKKITRNNSEFLGGGSFATVYRGTLPDNTMVAVKTLIVRREDGDRSDEFLGGVQIQTSMIHRNILQYFGFCEDLDCPISVHEYAANGSLQDILHGNKKQIFLPVELCLDLATGSAEGLRYMHSKDIRHGCVKPSNILLDEKLTPKIAYFELWQLLNLDGSVNKAIFVGCMGYIDPVFMETGILTEKSDVYSFGAVLLELITRRKNVYKDNFSQLIMEYRKCYELDKCGRAMFDKKMTVEEDIFVLEEIGKLAIECVKEDREKRPDMTEVTERLVSLKRDMRLEKAHNQDGTGKLPECLSQEHINERPETECEENTDDWSSWEVQDTEPKDNNQGTSISSSNSSVLDKLNIFKIFRRDAHKKSAMGGELRLIMKFKIFTKQEIEEITRNYSELIGRGNFGNVYKGNLPDNTIAAVRTEINVNGNREQEFHHSVEIQTMIHTNILRLFGCCFESGVQITVHEYAAKGSLQDILHGKKKKTFLPVELCLDIAIGSAEGLRYIHSRHIKHGYVKPSNIFLDEKLTPKIAYFEFWPILDLVGSVTNGCRDFNYTDPAYMYTGITSLKSDVYSFGAVLLELITRKKFVYNDNCRLIGEYCKIIQVEKSGRAMFDEKITEEEDISVLEEIGKLAIECLKEDKEERPDMTEVTERLVRLRRDKRLEKAYNRS